MLQLDKVVTDHSQENLEATFGAKLIAELPFFSIMVKETSIPWLVFIPKRDQTDHSVMLLMYGQVLTLANAMMAQGKEHYNFAKIGNKNEWLHFHLVFRSETDEAWPDPIWCREPLTPNPRIAEILKKQVIQILKDSDSTGL